MILMGAGAAELLAGLHLACFPAGETWNEAAMAELLAMPGCFAVVAEADRGADGLALARMAADEAELLTLGVLPQARRRGVARGLLRELAGEAASRGARSLILEVSVANLAALALYRGDCFAEVGRRRRYYSDGGDALILRQALR